MRIVVVGAGVVGVATAWVLNKRGHAVTVVDRRSSSGLETSFANGGLLTPSMSEPWNSPGCWRTLLGSLGRSDAALQVRLAAMPSLATWGIQFLWNSRRSAFARNTQANLKLALYSLEMLHAIQSETNISFGGTARGSLRIFRDKGAFEAAVGVTRGRASEGLRARSLTTGEAATLEPALSAIAAELVGAIHFPQDETGDAHRFCIALTKLASDKGVEFRYDEDVRSVDCSGGSVRAVATSKSLMIADACIIAAGSYSAKLSESAGIRLPIRPAKGYSVTFKDSGVGSTLRIPIVDDALHAVIVPFEGAIRVAGTAEFAGFDCHLSPARIDNLVSLVRGVLPDVDLPADQAVPWCGLRAMSADGVPIIGSTGVTNLFMNCGHGHLGWTMAAGCAALLADLVDGVDPAVDPIPYSISRFGGRSC